MAGVLVVESDPFVRHLMRITLEAQWHAVFEATDDEEALHILTASRDPLVVILSSRIPPVDGYQLLQAVATDRRLRSRHAFLVMTRDAGWLPPSFQLLQEVLNLRHVLRPKNLTTLSHAIGDLVTQLPTPSVTRPYRKHRHDTIGTLPS